MNEKEIFIIHPYLKTNRLLKDSDLVEAQKLIEAIDWKSRYIQSIGLEKINRINYYQFINYYKHNPIYILI